mmetsp:Transcript_15905/g.22427  ORF Transcript_15905/g.22427 Transcript_15905/m.22427 type:complete len:337 (-) Transcript_15905:87-1097(-)
MHRIKKMKIRGKSEQSKMKVQMTMSAKEYQQSFEDLVACEGLKPSLSASSLGSLVNSPGITPMKCGDVSYSTISTSAIDFDSSISSFSSGSKESALNDDSLSQTPPVPELKTKEPKSVRFHQITIREYERILGDNPAVSSGPPISLGWRYNQDNEVSVDIDDYESAREQQDSRRNREELKLDESERAELLEFEWGYSFGEIRKAQFAAREIRRNRIESRCTPVHIKKREELWEKIRRRVSNIISKHRKLEEQRLWHDAYHSMLQSVKRQEEQNENNVKKSSAREKRRSSLTNSEGKTSEILKRVSNSFDLVVQLEDHDFAEQSNPISKRINSVVNL